MIPRIEVCCVLSQVMGQASLIPSVDPPIPTPEKYKKTFMKAFALPHVAGWKSVAK